uniref:Bis(5'-nucleosyl)-tetraphosphatase [asymmetrical] n=1 Tax=Xenopsylla cheopis TaxID=163159 RepID=A0A6M2DPM5_XENCH
MVVKAAGFVIFRRIHNTIEYLLLQASYANFHWSPPKGMTFVLEYKIKQQNFKIKFIGHIDNNENEYDSAFRETLEETGLSKEDYRVYNDCTRTLSYEAQGKPKTVVYWLAELLEIQKKITLSNEHQAYKWLELHEATELVEYSNMKELLEYCSAYIKKIK